MGQKLTDTGTDREFEKLDPGTYVAVCTAQVGIAWQETHYGEKEQIKVRFEVPSERITYEKDGVEVEGPMVIWKTYTASLNEKSNLRKDLVAWRGRDFSKDELAGFDIGAIVGKPCQIVVVHREGNDGRTYANVQSVTGIPKGYKAPRAEGDLIDFNPYSFTTSEFEALPEWLRERVHDGLELYERMKRRNATSERFERDMDDYHDQRARTPSGTPNMNRVDPSPTAADDFVDDDIPF